MNALSAYATDLFGVALSHMGFGAMHGVPEQISRKSAIESIEFAHALVALMAKVAEVDGAPNISEYRAVAGFFADSDVMDAPRLRSLFMRMIGDTSSAKQFARQLVAMVPGDHHLYNELLEKLVVVASADAPLNQAEINWLQEIASVFGVNGDAVAVLLHSISQPQSAYAVLGISADATADEVRERYLVHVQRLHPDRVQAAGGSSDMIAQLSGQLAVVNAAYNDIKRQHTNTMAASAPVTVRWSRKNTKGANA